MNAIRVLRVAGTVLCGALSIALLTFAVDQEPIWGVVGPLFVGALFGAAGILFAWTVIHTAVERLGWLLFALTSTGLLLTAIGVLATSAWLAPAGLLITMFGQLAMYELLAQLNPDESSERTRKEETKAKARLTIGVALLVVAVPTISHPSSVVTAAGLAIALVALILVKIGTTQFVRAVPGGRGWAEGVHRRALWAVLLSGGLAVAGVVLVVVAPSFESPALHPLAEVAGATLAVAGLSAVGLAAVNLAPDSRAGAPANRDRWIGVALVGGLLCLAGALLVIRALPNWGGLAYTAILVTVTLGVFFVWRGEGVIAMVMIGFVLAWVLVDRMEEPERVAGVAERAAIAEAERLTNTVSGGPPLGLKKPEPEVGVIVAFGDSFTSGQGHNRYAAGTNTQSADGNSCRRSPQAYSYLLGLRLDREVRNYACEGAKLEDLTEVPQNAGALRAPEVPYSLPQVEHALAVDRDRVDLVLFGATGNDVQFSTVVAACVLPSDCTEASERFEAEVALIGDELGRRIREVREIFGAHPPIIVIPYPNYIRHDADDQDCGLAMTNEEADFGVGFVEELNQLLERVSWEYRNDNVHFFPDIDRAFEGRTLCGNGEAGANLIRLVPQEGSILDRMNPTSWHGATMHPNDLGHRCVAKALDEWLVASFPDLASEPSTNYQIDCAILGAPSAFVPAAGRAEPQEVLENTALTCTMSDAEVRPTGSCELPEEKNGDEKTKDLRFESCVDGAETKDVPRRCNNGDRCVQGPAALRDRDGCFDEDKWVADQIKETARKLSWPLGLVLLGGAAIALGITRAIGKPVPVLPFLPDLPIETPESRADRRSDVSGLEWIKLHRGRVVNAVSRRSTK